ncbi:hypothetical protein F5888DRAFT_1712794 [Russula emetica]|nr:hypothetical protein F5888DRAFT_1712794 [Russula emetica]
MAAQGEDTVVVNKNKRFRKDKPWDTDDIDHVGDKKRYLTRSFPLLLNFLHSGRSTSSQRRTTRAALSSRNHPMQLYFPSTAKSIFERRGARSRRL